MGTLEPSLNSLFYTDRQECSRRREPEHGCKYNGPIKTQFWKRGAKVIMSSQLQACTTTGLPCSAGRPASAHTSACHSSSHSFCRCGQLVIQVGVVSQLFGRCGQLVYFGQAWSITIKNPNNLYRFCGAAGMFLFGPFKRLQLMSTRSNLNAL